MNKKGELEEREKKFGWYSHDCAVDRGYRVYRDKEGNEFKVTHIGNSRTESPVPSSSLYKDVSFTGEIKDFVCDYDNAGRVFGYTRMSSRGFIEHKCYYRG